MRNSHTSTVMHIAVALTSLATSAVYAQRLEVIVDNGQGVPMGQYNDVLITGVNRDEAKFTQFPVRSELKPGVLTKPVQVLDARSAQWLARPLALVGSDTRSLAWLKTNAEALARVGADVFVVDVPDAQTFKAVVKAGGGLRNLTPTPSPRLAAQLKSAKAGVLPLFIDTSGRASQVVSIEQLAQAKDVR